MRVQFNTHDNSPARLVCDAEIVFAKEDGPLAETKLVGFSLWRGAEGEVYMTFPSRSFGAGGERRFFDYLRSVDGTAEAIKAVSSRPDSAAMTSVPAALSTFSRSRAAETPGLSRTR
jgi:hypothetical protein